MHADEVVGWADLAAEVVARGVDHVEDVHRAVAGRVHRWVGRGTAGASTPARVLHDTIGRFVHASVRHGGRAGVRILGRAAGAAWPDRTSRGVVSPVAATAQATVVGLIGHELAAAGNPVAWPLGLRHRGADVAVTRPALATAYPDATDRLVVLLPGLFETEHAWRVGAERWWGTDDATLAHRLAGEGWTPLHVRYPSGLPLAANGRALAELLGRVTEAWPQPVEELVLVGHSMGGLVARHALHLGHAEDQPWVRHVRRLVCLGTPHGGSPVARAAATAARVLGAVPETRGIGAIVDLRSPGIRDLEVTAPVADVPGVEVHVVGAVVGRRDRGVAAEVLGDLLVGASSAGGRAGDGSRAHVASARTFPRLHHFDLLNHPDVDAHVRGLLRTPVGALRGFSWARWRCRRSRAGPRGRSRPPPG